MAKNTFSYDEAFLPEASLVPAAKTFSYEDALLPVAKEKTPVESITAPKTFSFEDAFTPVTAVTPTATKPAENYSAFDFLSDAAKKAGASLVSGLSAAPMGIEAAVRNIPRNLKDIEGFSPPELLYKGLKQAAKKELSVLTGKPYSFTQEVIGGIKEKELDKEVIDKAISSIPNVPGLKTIADYGQRTGQNIRDTISTQGQKASADSQMSGNLAKAIINNNYSNLTFGKDPSLAGYALNTSEVLGSLGPVIATALITRSPTATAIVGGGMGAGEGVTSAQQYIGGMTDAELTQASPYYASMVKRGMDPTQARKIVTDKASEYSAQLQGAVATFGSQFTGKLMTGAFDKVLNKAVKNKLGKIAVGGAIGGAEEGSQEFVEGIAADMGINSAVVREIGTDSFANFVMGALGGVGPGAYAGYKAKPAEGATPAEETEIPLPNVAGLSDEQLQQSRADYIKGVKEKLRSRAAALNELELPAAAEEAVAQPAPIVAEEVAAPTTTLNPDTLRSLGLRSNTNAFKALNGVDIATPEGRDLFEQTLAANTGKVNEEAVNTLLTSLPPIELEVQNEPIQPTPIEPTADRAGVSTLDEQRNEVPTQGAIQADRGAVDTAGVDVGQPAGGTKPVETPLESLAVEPEAPKTFSFEEAFTPAAIETPEPAVIETPAPAAIETPVKTPIAEPALATKIPAVKEEDAVYNPDDSLTLFDKTINREGSTTPEKMSFPTAEAHKVTLTPEGYLVFRRESDAYEEPVTEYIVTKDVKGNTTLVPPTDELLGNMYTPIKYYTTKDAIEFTNKYLSQINLAKEPEAAPVVEETVAPVAEEAVAPEPIEAPVAEDPTKQARSLSSKLRSLDPTNPLIEDLLAYDVDEDTVAEATAIVDQIVQERQAKGQTQPSELRELSEDLAATEGEPETEAVYRSEIDVDVRYKEDIEDLDTKYANTTKALEREQAALEKARGEHFDIHNELDAARRSGNQKNIDYWQNQYKYADQELDRATYRIKDIEAELESINLDRTIVEEEYKRDSKRAKLIEAEHYEGIIEQLIYDNAISTQQADFFRALLNGEAKAALKAIEELPLTQVQETRLNKNEPTGPALYSNTQLFKWYKSLARELLKSKVIPNKVIISKRLTENVAGDYNAETDTVRIDAGEYIQTLGVGNSYYDVVSVFLHEVMHSATVNAMSKGMANIQVLNRMEARARELEQDGTPNLARALRSEKAYKKAEAYLNTPEGIAAKNLFNIYDYLANFHSEVFTSKKHYGATNPLEMISEAFTNVRFQDLLMSLEIPKEMLVDNPEFKGRGFKNMLDAFVDAIRRLLLMPARVSNTALAAVLANTSAVVRQNRTVRTSTMEEKYGRSKIYEKYSSYGNTIASKASNAKKQAIDKLQKKSGIKKPSNDAGKNLFKSVMETDLNHAVDNLSSAVLSSDNGLNNQMRTALEKAGMPWSQIKQILEGLMTSQATHSQNVASMFLEMGKITYDTVANMFHVSENPSGSWGGMMETIGDIAKKYGMKMDEMELAAHTYFVANRARGIIKRNKQIEKKALALEKAGKRKAADALLNKLVLVHMTPAEIQAGMNIRREIPELGSVFEQWHTVRQEVISHLVTTGLYSQEQAAELWETFDYVPFYREAQIEANQGPKENSRGLLDRARDKHLKGSYNPVNNVFDNMNRWITYSIARGINNSQAQYAVNAMQQHMVGSISPKPLPPTAKVTPGNLVAVWENGEEKRYRVEDPMFVHYFTGARAAYAPLINTPFVTGVNKVFRAEIILDPLFSAGQVMMDGLTAMFTSGTKNFYMLPIRAIKEFLLTLPNWSKTHKALRGYGAVGETDFASVSKRISEEAKYGSRDLNTAEKIATTLLKPLRWITTASDNAIRQAVYEQEMAESGDKATAVRKAFEIINFRRAGYSSRINTLRQSVNFTGAYLQYLNVTGKVLSGKGITPTQKKQTYVRLLNSLAGYGLFSFIMFMSVSDDDEYQETDQTTRDLRIFIPGLTEKTGVWLPVRADPFMLVAKMIPEHIYNLSRKEGGEDWTKFKKAFEAYMDSAMLGPTPIPQLPKVALETMMNKSITTGRPIVGSGIEGRATEREFTSTTSEFSKMLGSTGLVSPVMADYWINNLGASVGRAFIFLSNAVMKDSEAPQPSTRDKLASFAPKFIKREFGTRAKNDLYELRDVVDEAYQTFKDVEKIGSEAEYNKTYEETIDKVMQKPGIDIVIDQLAQIRAEERMILQRPPGDMDKAEKERYIKELRDREQVILFDIQYKRDLSGLDKGNPLRKAK